MTEEMLWAELNDVAHPTDRPLPPAWKPYYWSLYCLAKKLRPRRICEIGVRAGYSTYTLLRANPTARLLGIEADLDEAIHNTHGGRKGMYRHALQILGDFDFDLIVANSHDLSRLPVSDLIYVDGDHSYEGCLADLTLASQSTDTILVDDYHSFPNVRSACDDFLGGHPEFDCEVVENHHAGFLLIQRTAPATASSP